MTDERLRRAATGLAVASIAATLVGIALTIAASTFDLATGPSLIVAGVVYAAIGARIVRRQPRNPVGWLLLGSGLSFAITLVLDDYASLAVATDPSLFAASFAAWLGAWTWIPGAAMFLVFVPLVFPDGRVLSRRWWWFAVVVAVMVTLDTLAHAAAGWPHVGDLAYLTGTFNAGSEPGLMGVAADQLDSWFVLAMVSVVSIVVRFRRSSGTERLQVRWFALAIAIAAVAILIEGAIFEDPGGPLLLIAITVIPISIGVAMLRYRLYDLDRLVSRTIAYGLVTGALVAAYAALILLLEGPLSSLTGGDTVAVALSTLIVAAMFQPILRRVRRLVDSRFDRARYDGERTASAFAGRMRGAADLEAVSADLGSTVRGAMVPSGLGLWLRGSHR